MTAENSLTAWKDGRNQKAIASARLGAIAQPPICKPIQEFDFMSRWEQSSLISANTQLRTQLEIATMALQFYAQGKHFTVVDGSTGIIDNGGTAEEALAIIQGDKPVKGDDVVYMRHVIECATRPQRPEGSVV